MDKVSTHDRKLKSRGYRGSADAEPLLHWLNRTESRGDEVAKIAVGRVIAIVDSITRIHVLAKTHRPKGGWRRKPKAIRDEEAALNARLVDYEFSHAVDYSMPEPLAWTLASVEKPTWSGYVAGEESVVYRVVELSKQGLAWRIRKCVCGVYFFGRLPNQRFHAPKCREQFWEKSPARQERKRELARDYYKLQQSGKVK